MAIGAGTGTGNWTPMRVRVPLALNYGAVWTTARQLACISKGLITPLDAMGLSKDEPRVLIIYCEYSPLPSTKIIVDVYHALIQYPSRIRVYR